MTKETEGEKEMRELFELKQIALGLFLAGGFDEDKFYGEENRLLLEDFIKHSNDIGIKITYKEAFTSLRDAYENVIYFKGVKE